MHETIGVSSGFSLPNIQFISGTNALNTKKPLQGWGEQIFYDMRLPLGVGLAGISNPEKLIVELIVSGRAKWIE